MGVRWTITFKTLSGHDGLVKVYDNDYSGTAIELMPAASPFFTSRKQSSLFDPIMPDSGYIRIIDNGEASDYIEELHPLSSFDRPVEFFLNNVLKWRGYISPESFTVNWESAPRELSFPVVGALEILRSVDIQDKNVGLQPIAAFLKECLEATGFSWTAIDMVDQMKSITDGSTLYDVPELRLMLSRYNFLEANKSVNKDDADWTPLVGKSYYDVLYSICQYFGWIAIQNNSKLYLSSPYVSTYLLPKRVSWSVLSALAADPELTPSGAETLTSRSLELFSNIGFDGIEHRRSLKNGYRKIILTTDYNLKDEIYPQIDFKGRTLQTFDNQSGQAWGNARCEVLDVSEEDIDGLKAYQHNGGASPSEYHEVPWTVPDNKADFASRIAAWLVKIDSWQDSSGKINYSYINAIRICRYGYPGKDSPSSIREPLISIHSKDIGVFLAGGALCLSCNVWSSYFKDNFDEGPSTPDTADTYGLSLWGPLQHNLLIRLRIGDKWYDGTTWGDTPTLFAIGASNGGSYNWRNAPKSSGQITNTKTLSMPYNGAVGYIIPITETLQGRMTIELSRPIGPQSLYNGVCAVFLSNISAKYYNDSASEKNDGGLRLSALTGAAFQSELSQNLRLSSIVDARIGSAILWWKEQAIGTEEIFGYDQPVFEQAAKQPEYWLLGLLSVIYSKPSEWLTLETVYKPDMEMWNMVSKDGKLYVITSCETDYADEHTKLTIASYE